MIIESYELICDGDDCYETIGPYGAEHDCISVAKQDGWTMEGDKAYCPECQAARI